MHLFNVLIKFKEFAYIYKFTLNKLSEIWELRKLFNFLYKTKFNAELQDSDLMN